MRRHSPYRSDPLAGALAGAIAGVVGTLAMGVFEVAATRAMRPWHSPRQHARRRAHAGGGALVAQSEPRSHEHAVTSSEQLVDRLADAAGTRVGPGTRHVLGSAWHYLFGAAAGAIYGAAAEAEPRVTVGAGTAFGATVWLAADEVGIPLVKLGDPPWRTPPRLHAYSLLAHFAYGLGTEAARRLLRPLVSRPF